MISWLRLIAALVVSVALVAAPCKNCEPKQAEAQPQHCQHDCCPKPKPEKQSCKWQPADYAAVEAKQEAQAAPDFEFDAVIEEASAHSTAPAVALAPQAEAEPPPLYLSHRQLRN